MHPRLSEVAQYVADQRRALLAAADPLPGPLWTVRPAGDRWSVADVLEHLHRVERGSAKLIALRVAQAREAGHPRETETGSVMESLAHARLTDRSRPIAAPERVAPEGGWSREAVLAALAESRAVLDAAVAAADGLALGTLRHEHPRLGDIDLYQWLLFIGQHEARHVAQVAEIVDAVLASAGDDRELARSPLIGGA